MTPGGGNATKILGMAKTGRPGCLNLPRMTRMGADNQGIMKLQPFTCQVKEFGLNGFP
jgi:hypothetical protein